MGNALKRHRPARVEPGTVVARPRCADCGGRVEVKINKRQIAYYFCHNERRDEFTCGHHERWGRAGTIDLLKRYLHLLDHANTNAPPSGGGEAVQDEAPPGDDHDDDANTETNSGREPDRGESDGGLF